MAISTTTYKNSKYIRLTDYCVAEYVYKDDTVSTETDEYKMVYTENSLKDIRQIFNEDGDESITNNIMKYTAVPYSNNRFYAFTRDAKSNLEVSDEIFFSHAYNDIKYYEIEDELSMDCDILRFHFMSGWLISSRAAIIVGLRNIETDGKYNFFSSLYLNSQNFSDLMTYNERPIYMSDAKYDKYIEIKVPSVRYINDQRKLGNTELSEQLSKVNFIYDAPMVITLDECDGVYVENSTDYNYYYYDASDHYESSIPQYNEYDSLNANISEATDGNYFIFGLRYNEGSVSNFINKIDSDMTHWSIMHTLVVYEYNRNGSVTESDHITVYQDSDLDTLKKYRPILSNASSDSSFAIDYTARLINNSSNEQIVRESSVLSYNKNKYGKNTLGISGITSLNVQKIYNKLYTNNDSVTETFREPIYNSEETVTTGETVTYTQKTSYPLYIDSRNIYITNETPAINAVDDTSIIYGQYDLNLILNPIDTTLKFTLYEKGDTTYSKADLTDKGSYISYKMIFIIDDEAKITIQQSTDSNSYMPSMGELVFDITESEVKQILASSSRSFYIVSYNYVTMKNSALYCGYWLNNTEVDKYRDSVEYAKEKYKAALDSLTTTSDDTSNDEITSDVYISGYVDDNQNDTSSVLSMNVTSES